MKAKVIDTVCDWANDWSPANVRPRSSEIGMQWVTTQRGYFWRLRQWLIPYRQITRHCNPYPNGTDVETAFRQTVTAGLKYEGDGPPASGIYVRSSDDDVNHVFDALDRWTSDESGLFLSDFLSVLDEEDSSNVLNRMEELWPGHSDVLRHLLADLPHLMASRLAHELCNGRHLFTTVSSYMGLAPGPAPRRDQLRLEPDRVCVIPGGCTPFILRPVADGPDHFRLVGECFIYGLMDGEAFDPSAKDTRLYNTPLKEIILH